MTVKNLPQRSSQSVSLNISRSDMPKRGAVRNLFNATVDREELQMQINQLERESSRQLKSYKVDSIIGVIDSAREDQGRKLKRAPSCLDTSDDDDESDDQPQRTATTDRELPESSSDNSSPASPSPPAPSTSSKKSDHKVAQPRSLPLAKGQKTIKGNYDERCTPLRAREKRLVGPRKGR